MISTLDMDDDMVGQDGMKGHKNAALRRYGLETIKRFQAQKATEMRPAPAALYLISTMRHAQSRQRRLVPARLDMTCGGRGPAADGMR